VDEEAKVRASATLDVDTGVDEPLEAVAPRFVFGVNGFFRKAAAVAVVVLVALQVVHPVETESGVVRKEDADDAVAPSSERHHASHALKVVAHEIGPGDKSGLVPDSPVVSQVVFAGSGFPFGQGGHAGSAWMVHGGQKGMNPQFVVDGAGAWGGVNIDGVISRLLSVPIQHGSPVGRHPHGVVECVELAYHVFVFVDV
jgi:hypothetical protein